MSTINYQVITPTLLARLEPLGWCHVDGIAQAADPVAAQAVIDAYTLDHYIADRKAEVTAHAYALRARATAGVNPAEMSAWSIKSAQAAAVLADPTASAPLLAAEAATRGVAVRDIAARVAANAGALGMLEASIAGRAGKHADALAALKTWASVRDYDVTVGWPQV